MSHLGCDILISHLYGMFGTNKEDDIYLFKFRGLLMELIMLCSLQYGLG